MSTTTTILGLIKNVDGDNARTIITTDESANMDILESVLTGADAVKIPNAALAADVRPCVRAFHNANQSVANDAWTGLNLNQENYDTDTMHDLVTNNSRLTCKTAGKYSITACIRFATSATGYRGVSINLNAGGSIAMLMIPAVNGDATRLNVTTDWNMTVNDFVECMVFQTSGASLGAEVESNIAPVLSMARIG